MSKKNKKEVESTKETKEKGFSVFDSNGKLFRIVGKEEDAHELAKSIGGKVV